MASTHHFFLGLTLLLALSFSTLEMVFGARSLATLANSESNQAKFSKKQIPLPSNKMEIPTAKKQSITLPESDQPKTGQNGVKQSLYPSFPGGFTFPGNFNIPRNFNFPPLTPYLSSPSLPWPDLPLVPAIPFTPPTLPVPISDQTPSDGDQEAEKVQSP